MLCEQVADVLSLLEELKEEGERLRRNQPVGTFPPLREIQRMEAQQGSEEP